MIERIDADASSTSSGVGTNPSLFSNSLEEITHLPMPNRSFALVASLPCLFSWKNMNVIGANADAVLYCIQGCSVVSRNDERFLLMTVAGMERGGGKRLPL